MFHLTLSPEIKSRCPEYRGAAVLANVTNTPYSEGLWQEIDAFTQTLRASETAAKPTVAWAKTQADIVPRLKPCGAGCCADWNCTRLICWWT